MVILEWWIRRLTKEGPPQQAQSEKNQGREKGLGSGENMSKAHRGKGLKEVIGGRGLCPFQSGGRKSPLRAGNRRQETQDLQGVQGYLG
jgi:hypothetical protein